MKIYCVYLMASGKNGTIYLGVTNNLLRRVIEHKKRKTDSFSKKYHVNNLVYYEQTNDVRIAIQREKQIKGWKRKWKIALIEKKNPKWNDLFYEIGGEDEMLENDFQFY